MHFVPSFIPTLLIGLVLGSFTSALSYRVARGLPWIGGRSICPACGHKLGAPDLIPILSWLVLRGRCRHCGHGIGLRYPLIELTILAGCLGLYASWGLQPQSLIAMAALPFLLTLLLVDLDRMILPDSMQAVLAGLGVLFVGALAWTAQRPQLLLWHAGAAILFAALVWLAGKAVSKLRRREALGFGDVKFFAVAGLWLGLALLPWFLIAGGVAGVMCGLGWRLARRGRVFPFGPGLIAGFYLCLLLKGAGFSGIFALN